MTGLIPACAGKTLALTSSLFQVPAHPRVCGENRIAGIDAKVRTGSSPRVRGKQPPEILETALLRLIPACAGKTCSTFE